MNFDIPAGDQKRQFNVGDVVYFVSDVHSAEAVGIKLQVKKGTVHATHNDGELREELAVRTWPNLDEEPSGIRVSVARHPDTLLTEAEVRAIAIEQGEPTNPSVDETIKANPDQLALVIGTTVASRQIVRDLYC